MGSTGGPRGYIGKLPINRHRAAVTGNNDNINKINKYITKSRKIPLPPFPLLALSWAAAAAAAAAVYEHSRGTFISFYASV